MYDILKAQNVIIYTGSIWNQLRFKYPIVERF